MYDLNLCTSAKLVIIKLYTLLVKLMDTGIFQMKLRSYLLLTDMCNLYLNIFWDNGRFAES